MEPFRIKAVKELIRDPKTGRRLVVGKSVAVRPTAYWLRRIRDKDVEKVGNEPAKPVQKLVEKSKPKVRPEVSKLKAGE